MGLKGWFPFICKKGYEPTVIQQSGTTTTSTTSTKRIDLLSRFSVIRTAYTQNSVEKAHAILEKDIEQFGSKDTVIVYVDGAQAQEKEHTAQARQKTREKAASRCKEALDFLQDRINRNLKVRKRHFTDVKTNMASTFYWSLPIRASFVEYMTQAGWKVQTCETEADVAIARDCEPGDIVVSADSDMMAYPSISTLWRPIARNLILVYNLKDVRRTLDLEAQLTALAVVSGNDYGKSIYSLGAATNYSVIKAIRDKDTLGTVAEYLNDPKVASKNAAVRNNEEKTFEVAIKVFVYLKQTPVTSSPPSVGSPAYGDLHRRFLDLCALYRQQKENGPSQTSPPEVPIIRLHHSHAAIRFKTVESPAVLKRVSGHLGSLPSQELQSDVQDQSTVSSTSSQQLERHPPLARANIPKNRQRYSFKMRTGSTQRPPPDKMKVYKFKPYKEWTDSPEDSTLDSKAKPKVKSKPKFKIKTLATSTANTRKLAVMRHLAYHHPTSSLKVGTLAANVKRAVPNNGVLQQEVIHCIRDLVQEAARVKWKGQQVIGKFVDHINKHGLGPIDRQFMDLFCPRVSMNDVKDEENEETEEEEDGDSEDDLDDKPKGGRGSAQSSFLLIFLTSMYSGNRPRNTGTGSTVNEFIDRLIHPQLYTPPPPASDGCKHKAVFTPSELVASVSTQLRVELKKMYKNGSCDLYKKLMARKEKGLLGSDVDVEIQGEVSAVENFLALNRISPNPRRIIPITSSRQPFVSFTERNLVGFFFSRGGVLRAQVQELVGTICTSIADAQEHIGNMEPGILIKKFLADIGLKGLTSRQRRKAGHRGAIELLNLEELETDLHMLDSKDFRPETYLTKKYVPRGTVRTDGFHLQLLCFKRRELLSVKWKRLPQDRLPRRLTTTLHGTGDHLTEIRNVLGSKEDIAQLWPDVDPRDIKTLTLDAGQAFVVGAYAHLPQSSKGKDPVIGAVSTFEAPFTIASSTTPMAPPPVQESTQSPSSAAHHNKTPHHNLAVNQKAVMQPTFRYRRWLQEASKVVPEGQPQSIEQIESQLPPLRGPEASVTNYVARLKQVEDQLMEFYNGNNNRFKKNTWDMERAKHIECQAIANSLLKIVGGSIGERCKSPVLIGVGLGDFRSSKRLSSLHGTFLSYFIPLARSLGYVVVGIEEYYTSKKCPNCEEFVAQVTIRQLFCPHCGKYYHRDVMAAQNMSNIVQGHLLEQKRPLYLQPKTADGRYPWIEPSTSDQGAVDGTSKSTGSTSARKKRSSPATPTSRKRPTKMAKEL